MTLLLAAVDGNFIACDRSRAFDRAIVVSNQREKLIARVVPGKITVGIVCHATAQ